MTKKIFTGLAIIKKLLTESHVWTSLQTFATLKITTGAGAGKIFTSGVDGDATWVTPPHYIYNKTDLIALYDADPTAALDMLVNPYNNFELITY